MILDIFYNVVEIIFLAIIVSYYFLLFKKKNIETGNDKFNKITILIPARNEEKYVAETIDSALNAKFNGKKEIILIDDASTDKTYCIAKKFPIKVIRNSKHEGKAYSLNLGLTKAHGGLIAVIDADSVIQKDAIIQAEKYLASEKVAGVTSIIKVKNSTSFIGMWLNIEQLYNSLIRNFMSKIDANISTPGPLSIYKKKELLAVGGFETKMYLEDIDIAVKLIRSGKKIAVSENSIAETNMPHSLKGFIKQRTRFARGWIHILKRHFQLNNSIIDIYTLPMALFWYIQAIVMSIFISFQIISGYYIYFFLKNIVFSWEVVRYFFEWLSIVGVIKWTYNILIGSIHLNFFTFIALMATLLSYPLYLIAIFKYDKINIYHLFPLFFMFPYWFIIMIIYIFNIPEWFVKDRINRWEKIN